MFSIPYSQKDTAVYKVLEMATIFNEDNTITVYVTDEIELKKTGNFKEVTPRHGVS